MTIGKTTTVYVKLGEGREVRVEMTRRELLAWGDVNERELTVAELDAVAAKLSAKDYLCKSTID